MPDRPFDPDAILQPVRRLIVQSFSAHERIWLTALLLVALVLRGLLVAFSPTPFGYVWDFYQDGVRIAWNNGHLPRATDCWQCYHPPLFYLLGLPLYGLGRSITANPATSDALGLRLLAGLAVVSAAATIYYGYRLLRLFRCRGGSLVAGVGLLASLPVLFISSYGAEADIVLTAILSAFIYYFASDFVGPGTVRGALRLGLLAGLGAATKYSGLVAVVSASIFFAIRLVSGPRRLLALRNAAIVVAICAAVGGWKYVDNYRQFGMFFVANGSAQQGFSLAGMRGIHGHYEFNTLRFTALMDVFGPHAVRGTLTDLPVYDSVFTTLHALTWTDMSFFSEPDRHGDPVRPYPRKRIPSILIGAVLVLGFVPEILSALGFIVAIHRRSLLPLAIVCVVSVFAYVWWFIAQESWALKTKYVLFLAPAFGLYMVIGLGFLWHHARPIGVAAAVLTAALIVVANMYLLAFAVA